MKTRLLLALLMLLAPGCASMTAAEREAVFRLGLEAGHRILERATK
jgi:hypothetical protein